ncbi:MAG: Glu-tRNA(Gln) amidotransferase GatDE subunit E, partial [Thermoprotei archaeon]
SKSKLVHRAIKRGSKALAVCLPRFKGILGAELQPKRRFGTELADYARQWSGVGGIVHSDELPGYGIDATIVKELQDALRCSENDAFVIVIDESSKALDAINVVKKRAAYALIGVPKETRAANPDGTTRYMRPQPGAARMYPETDIPPITVTEELLKEAERYRPPTPDEKVRQLIKHYELSRELAWQLTHSEYLSLFERIAEKYRDSVAPTIIASTLVSTLKSLASEGVPVENITDEHLEELFKALARGALSKEAIPEVLKAWVHEPGAPLNKILDKLALRPLTRDELERIVDSIISKYREQIARRGERAFGLVMGRVMDRVRGRADGRVVAEVVRAKLREVLKGS